MRNKKREREEKRVRAMASEMCAPYREQINGTPAMISLLYDLGLLPEQIRNPINAVRMAAVCELLALLTPEQIDTFFKRAEG